MNFPRLVCPNDRQLFHSFSGRTVAVRVNDPRLVAEAVENVRDSANELLCCIIELTSPLAELELGADREGVPLAAIVPSMGKFRDLARRLDAIRELNLRVYLPCDDPDNIAGLRVLSSVGVHTCAVLSGGAVDWEALTDLMTYAVLGRAPHASIEPFAFIVANYDPASSLDWGSTQLDEARHFLHLDADGRVALSRAELAAGSFVAGNIAEIGAPEEFPAIRERTQAWRRFFIENHQCASCQGWKICLGRFAANLPDDRGCSDFLSETLDVVRQHRSLTANPREARIWQQ